MGLLLKLISVIILFAMVATSSTLPPPCGGEVRGRNYRAQVIPKSTPDAGFYIPSGSIVRSFGYGTKERRAEDSPEQIHLDSNDYFNPDYKNVRPRSSGHQVRLWEEFKNPSIATWRRNRSSGLRGQRLGQPSAIPRRRNEGEYGYNYQGGTGNVQIHQHIHEYRFDDDLLPILTQPGSPIIGSTLQIRPKSLSLNEIK